MYLSVHFPYGAIDEWAGKKPACLVKLTDALQGMTDDTEFLKLRPRLFLDNISDIPVLEVTFGQALNIYELGDSGRCVFSMTNEVITAQLINEIYKILNKYSSVNRVSHGVKFEVV